MYLTPHTRYAKALLHPPSLAAREREREGKKQPELGNSTGLLDNQQIVTTVIILLAAGFLTFLKQLRYMYSHNETPANAQTYMYITMETTDI